MTRPVSGIAGAIFAESPAAVDVSDLSGPAFEQATPNNATANSRVLRVRFTTTSCCRALEASITGWKGDIRELSSTARHMRSWTKKLPKGRSYPLKPSVLEAALNQAGLTLPVELARIDSGEGEAFFATYAPSGSFPKGEIFEITCRSVPSQRVVDVRSALEAEAIPKFVAWAKQIESLDAHSPIRREHQHFKWAYPNNKS